MGLKISSLHRHKHDRIWSKIWQFILVYFIFAVNTSIQFHSYIPFAEIHSCFFHRWMLRGGPTLGCSAEIWTQARLPASRRTTNGATSHPKATSHPIATVRRSLRPTSHPKSYVTPLSYVVLNFISMPWGLLQRKDNKKWSTYILKKNVKSTANLHSTKPNMFIKPLLDLR